MKRGLTAKLAGIGAIAALSLGVAACEVDEDGTVENGGLDDGGLEDGGLDE